MRWTITLATALTMVVFTTAPTAAQNLVRPPSPFRPIDHAEPNTYRTASGRPGVDYWQQRVDYRMELRLDVDTHEVVGQESIRYRNNSPDDLAYLWMHIEPNMCAPQGVSNQLKQPPLIFLGSVFDFTCRGFEQSMTLTHLRAGGADLSHAIYGTTMRIDLPQPLASGGVIELDLAWVFPVPPWGMARMGRDDDLYQIAQFYPRMAVYDDVKGWNHEPYIGAGEFYLEYGDFDVFLDVPAAYIVAATGSLKNPTDVLTPLQRDRLEAAATASDPVAVITADEAGEDSRVHPGSNERHTWHFHAENVRDFAWAASPRYRWDAVSWNGILIQTLYRPEASARWEEAIHMAQQSIRYFSEQWYPYPYPQATTTEGPIEGMEYPMLTFVPNSPTREDLQWVLSHELGHQWVPMIVGSNERLYPWMDEGFNTFMDQGGTAQYFEGSDYGALIASESLRLYPENAIPGREQPLITPASEQYNLFWTAYHKPALMLQLLRREVLGPGRFDHAFRQYLQAWAYKHPTPTDFFRIMRDASGMDLDWFWRSWIFEAGQLDQAVESVASLDDGGTEVMLVNVKDMVMPVELQVTYAGGSQDVFRLPVEMWNQGPRFTYRLPGSGQVTAVTIDPRGAYPDLDRDNNTWSK